MQESVCYPIRRREGYELVWNADSEFAPIAPVLAFNLRAAEMESTGSMQS